MQAEPACLICSRFIESDDIKKSTCLAFTEGIPDEILFGMNDHTEPFPGDGGIQFERIKGLGVKEA